MRTKRIRRKNSVRKYLRKKTTKLCQRRPKYNKHNKNINNFYLSKHRKKNRRIKTRTKKRTKKHPDIINEKDTILKN